MKGILHKTVILALIAAQAGCPVAYAMQSESVVAVNPGILARLKEATFGAAGNAKALAYAVAARASQVGPAAKKLGVNLIELARNNPRGSLAVAGIAGYSLYRAYSWWRWRQKSDFQKVMCLVGVTIDRAQADEIIRNRGAIRNHVIREMKNFLLTEGTAPAVVRNLDTPEAVWTAVRTHLEQAQQSIDVQRRSLVRLHTRLVNLLDRHHVKIVIESPFDRPWPFNNSSSLWPRMLVLAAFGRPAAAEIL